MTHLSTRQHPRFPARLPFLFEGPAVPGYQAVGFTQNVSQGGLLLHVPEPLPPGTPASLLLLVGDGIARAEVAVVWMIEDTPCRMGVRFTELTGDDRLAWERLLAYHAGPTPRASIRIPIALEVSCLISPDTRVAGRVENLSDGGLMISLAQALAPRTRLAVSVPACRGLPAVEAEVEVLWTRTHPERHRGVHGLRFLSDDREKELFIAGALLRQLLDDDQPLPRRGLYLLALLARIR